MAEKVLVNEDGSVEHVVWPGDGQPPTVTPYESDEHYLLSQTRLERTIRACKSVFEKITGGNLHAA